MNGKIKITPKIVPADKYSQIKIKYDSDDLFFSKKRSYTIIYKPVFYTSEKSKLLNNRYIKVIPRDGILYIDQFFAGEQEHILIIKEGSGKKVRQLGTFHLYSLKADLFYRRPYKGDLHIHSCRSNGEGLPAYIAAYGRKKGLDFLTITDHRHHYPSVEAINTFADLDLDYQIIEGEEIHPPDSNNHIVNFGGRFSISTLFGSKQTRYRRETKKLEKSIIDLPAGVNRYEYASFVWVCNEIERAGGLSVFCHPYWLNKEQYYISAKLTTFLLSKQPFDAVELINGSISIEENNLQIAEYYCRFNNQRRDVFLAVVGVSDAHFLKDIGKCYTIVFAEELSTQNIIENIKNCYSIAVENIRGDYPRMYGNPRLIRYASFINREIFPAHDQVCYQEGKLMINYLNNKSEVHVLKQIQGGVNKLYQTYWKQTKEI